MGRWAQNHTTRCEVQDAQQTLVVHLAPDKNTKQQKLKMRETAIKQVDNIRIGKIPKDDIWLAFPSTIWKTLLYPLPAVNMTKEECELVMAPILFYLLPTIGVCRNFPRTFI